MIAKVVGSIKLSELDQVEQVFGEDAVIHRGSLKMPTVGQELLRQLGAQQLSSGGKPVIRFWSREERTGKNQSLGVCKQMIPQQVMLKPAGEVPRLGCETVDKDRIEIAPTQSPLDPICDAQR